MKIPLKIQFSVNNLLPFLCVLAFAGPAWGQVGDAPDIIFLNGSVITMAGGGAEAVAVRGDKIVAGEFHGVRAAV